MQSTLILVIWYWCCMCTAQMDVNSSNRNEICMGDGVGVHEENCKYFPLLNYEIIMIINTKHMCSQFTYMEHRITYVSSH